MGLRCSLLGHDYGDVVVEREREERGEEVVVTERELRECGRCGAESIVSENTEVRRLRPEEAANQSETADAEPAEGSQPLVEEAESSAAAAVEDDAIIMDDEAPPGDLVPESTDESADEDEAFDAWASLSEDAEGGSPEQDAGDGAADEGDAGAEDAADAEPAGTTAESSSATAESSTGDWPNDPGEPASDDPDDGSFQFGDEIGNNRSPAQDASEPASGIASAGPLDTSKPLDDDVEKSITCPACGFHVRLDRTSLRAGDICPDCHGGYLAEDR